MDRWSAAYVRQGKQVAVKHKEAVISGSLILYIGVYVLLGVGGLSFQSQPVLSYHIGGEEDLSAATVTPAAGTWQNQTFEVNASFTYPASHSGTGCSYNIEGTGWQDIGCGAAAGNTVFRQFNVPVGPSQPCSAEGVDTCNVSVRATNDANTTMDTRHYSIDYTAPLKPDLPEPLDGETIRTPFTNLSVLYDDPAPGNSGTLTYYNASDHVMIGSCSVVDGSRCYVNWTDLENGDHQWYVNATDLVGNTNRSSTWTLTVDPTATPLDTEQRITVVDQTVAVPLGGSRVVPVRLYNPEPVADTYEVGLRTSPTGIISAQIITGENLTVSDTAERSEFDLESEETRYIRVEFRGTSCLSTSCSATVTVEVDSLRTGERFTDSTPALVQRDPDVHGAPGLTVLQLLILALLAAAITWYRREV